jgi:hypothetical protein
LDHDQRRGKTQHILVTGLRSFCKAANGIYNLAGFAIVQQTQNGAVRQVVFLGLCPA